MTCLLMASAFARRIQLQGLHFASRGPRQISRNGTAVYMPQAPSMLVRAITVEAQQAKLREQTFQGANRMLRADRPEKREEKMAERDHLGNEGTPERPPALVEASQRIKELTRSGDYAEVLRSFKQTTEPDAYLYNQVLGICAREHLHREGWQLWRQMPKEMKNVISYSTMIDLCRRRRQTIEAEEIFAEMQQAGVEPSLITYRSMILVYSMTDQSSRALEVFESIREKVVAASTVSKQMTYLAVMSAFARSGDYAKTRELFTEMVEANVPPDHTHFNSLIASCARGCLEDTAQAIFDLMPQWGLTPRLEDYAILMSCYRHNLIRLKELLADMRSHGISPTGKVYRDLIEAHVHAGDGAGARELLAEAKVMDPKAPIGRPGSTKVRHIMNQLERLPL
eukprot:gnl/TRDRNA2_/TRDRNA2_92733_c0_seq1.p1 gnl/TRDRNA2_/TRDRNA2_92733_c0~~gnl/TRDRNA2_/TRDRNA2_92733_c0_seq1.p1  ORF type:complete len:397 (-),score=61.90 gnl/TRDRNA2_/TRDRNA2_92733_c0_seq1:80-1270(-)